MAWTAKLNIGTGGTTSEGSAIGTNLLDTTGCTLLVACVASGAGTPVGTGYTIAPGVWVPIGSNTLVAEASFMYACLAPPQSPAIAFTFASAEPTKVNLQLFGFGGHQAMIGEARNGSVGAAQALALPAVLAASTSLLITTAAHEDPVTATLAAPGATTLMQNSSKPFVAGATPGFIAFALTPTGPGSVPCTITSQSVVGPMAGVVAVIEVAPATSVPLRGVGPIANLMGKVTATNALDISTTVALADATRTGHLDGTTKYTDAVLIPAPAADQQVIVTGLSGSALVAGPFSVRVRTGATSVLGPVWLPSSGPAALVTGRTFDTGPILRALPPGQGLTITTSADAPQSFEATYTIVSVT